MWLGSIASHAANAQPPTRANLGDVRLLAIVVIVAHRQRTQLLHECVTARCIRRLRAALAEL
jgi:hypothetical protein